MNIDKIYEMLYWDNDEKVQERGIEIASKIKYFDCFIMPYYGNKTNGIWENCALIISKKTDDELRPYRWKLLEWIEDMNWPGADIIYDRLLKYNDKKELLSLIDSKISSLLKPDDPEITVLVLNDLKAKILSDC